ncbi:MAG: DNA polymerase III subunit gamma/tau [Acidobacteria bacterium]|nr:DNA polymerase III subunit gamma/tau [Acidobacteriota bacterium]
MTYQVIARKYRPQTFDAVIGQAPIIQTLKNAIEKNLVAHAYIFSGTRGVGKTTTARLVAKALNCVNGPTPAPCNACPPCQEIAAGTALDVLELDAASNRGIDEIRQLRENVRYLPARDRYKIFIIDEAHMLTTEAFNALLKTLEEPPERVLFILATTEPHKLPSTIHSRCQSFHFRSIGFQEILGVLERVAQEEGVEVEPEALAVMTRAAEGSLRDALSILDQAIAYAGKTLTTEQVRELLGVVGDEVLEALVEAVRTQSSEDVLRLVDALVREGHNLQYFCREALRHIRNLLLVRIGGPAAELVEAAGIERTKLEATARAFSEEDLLRFFNVLLRAEGELRWSPHPRLHLELALLKLVQAERLAPLEEILSELSDQSTPVSSNRPPERQRSNPPAQKLASPAPEGHGFSKTLSEAEGSRAELNAARSASSEGSQGNPSRARPEAEGRRVPPPGAAQLTAPAASTRIEQQLAGTTVEAIKAAVYGRSKFLGSLVENVSAWEQQKEGLQLWFSPEHRSLSEMLGRKEQGELEKIITQVLGEPVKISTRVGAPGGQSAAAASTPAPTKPPNAVVQALLERFGGTLRTAAEVPNPRPARAREPEE